MTICVSIGRTRHKMMAAEHRALAERGAQLVELRLDWLRRSPDLARLLEDRPTPTVVTIRRQSDKGHWKGTEEQRLTLLRSAIVAGVEYVDLEEDTARLVRRYGKTKRIISYHNFEETPENLGEIHARLAGADVDIVKMATMANTPGDSIRMLQLVAAAKIPTVAFCMGELGVPSRILTGRYGSPFTYATFNKDRALAPGQLTFEEMTDIYRYDRITPQTAIYGVLGDPIAHSMSPLLHNTSFASAGLDCVYLPFRVPKGSLPAALERFSWLPVNGYSVTIPHKAAAVQAARVHDSTVEQVAAANTLYHGTNGEWRSANTDYEAALDSLCEALQEGQPPSDASPLAGKKVLMLGAGGVARAIGRGVLAAGAALTVCSRTKQRGLDLAKSLDCQATQWENRGALFADVLINCTPVGMHPQVDDSPFAENWLREGMTVFDTIYNPERTLLIKQARDRGCRTVTGVEMFVRQAARQFELFTGKPGPVDEMRATLRNAISAVSSSP